MLLLRMGNSGKMGHSTIDAHLILLVIGYNIVPRLLQSVRDIFFGSSAIVQPTMLRK